jgi:hypothetical protein
MELTDCKPVAYWVCSSRTPDDSQCQLREGHDGKHWATKDGQAFEWSDEP